MVLRGGLAAVVAAGLLTAALAAGPAQAANPFTVGTGKAPAIVVTPNGTAHVAWLVEESGATPGKIVWCRIPAGAAACDRLHDVVLPDRPGETERPGAQVVLSADSDTSLDLVAGCYECWNTTGSTENVTRWSTTDAAATAPLTNPLLGKTPTTSGMSGPGANLPAGPYVGPAGGSSIIARPGAAEGTSVTLSTSGTFVYDPSVARVPGLDELVYAVNDLGTVKYAVYDDAGPALSAANIMTTGNWARDLLLGAPEPDSTETRLSAGPTAVVLTHKVGVIGDERAVVRRYDPVTNSFGPSVTVDGPAPQDSAVQELVSSQDAGGRTHVVWRNLFDTRRLRYARSDVAGAAFTAPANLAQGEDFFEPEVAAGADGNGYAVWRSGTAIRVVRLEPYAEPVAAPPPAGGAPPAPTVPTPSTPRTSVPAGRRVRATVPGATIDFGLPKACVQPGQTFRVTLRWKRQRRKGNRFVKVTRADFYIGTRRVRIDRRAPFVQTLRVTAGARRGSTITVRARAFIKVKRGKAPKKSIRSTIKVCP
jgi:hypothetical protein